jgi:hypothetical protein
MVFEEDMKAMWVMVLMWKKLPARIVEIITIISLTIFNIPVTFFVTLLAAALLTFFKFGLINWWMIYPIIYERWLKWPIRIVAIWFFAAHDPVKMWYLAAIVLFGAELIVVLLNKPIDRFLKATIDGQELEYRALQLIAERVPFNSTQLLGSFAQPLMHVPVNLTTGKKYDQLIEAIVDAVKIEETDPTTYAAIMEASSKILGKEDAKRTLEIHKKIESKIDICPECGKEEPLMYTDVENNSVCLLCHRKSKRGKSGDRVASISAEG